MIPQEYAAIIKNKAKFNTVFLQQDNNSLVICRGLTVGEADAIRSTVEILKVDDPLLLQSIFELTCVYPEDTSNVSIKVSISLAKQVIEDVSDTIHEDDKLSSTEEALIQSGQPIYFYKLMQSTPVSVSTHAMSQKQSPQKHEIRKGIFIEK